MEVLKLATAGSVDDGKSTLIGRLLYDTQSLTDDKLEAIRKTSEQRGYDYLDFSLATDGLVAEREQGITIDVAHIYFSTPSRSYIIADTPGHVEYTRNMVTGASNAKAAIVLIDARKGVVEQTYRHFFINALLRVKDVVVAVNKMDLVDFDQQAFENIKSTFQELVNKHGFDGQRITFIPISALRGDNVVERSAAMSWYQGPSILELLEDIPVEQNDDTAQFRFPVQTVIRPKTDGYHDFRGYAGKVYGSSIAVGDTISVLPWGTTSKVKAIHYYDTQYNEATVGSAVTLELEDDINIARGDMLVKLGEAPAQEKRLKATICWMDRNPLRGGAKYLVQHNTNKVLAKIGSIDTVLATDFSENSSADGLNLNQIGEVSLQLAKPVFADSYAQNKHNGSFILIDPQTHTTAGVGFVQ